MMPTIAYSRPVLTNPLATDYAPQSVAGMTLKRGDLARLSAAGLAVPAVTDTGLVMLAQDCTGVLGEKIAIYQVDENSRFEINLAGVLASTDLSAQYGWATFAGMYAINKADVTNLRFEVVEIDLKPASVRGTIADSNARVIAKPIGIGTNWK